MWGLHLNDFSSKFRCQLEMVKQMPLTCQRNPVGTFSWGLYIQYKKLGIISGCQPCDFPYDLTGSFLITADAGHKPFVAYAEILWNGILHFFFYPQSYLFQCQLPKLKNMFSLKEIYLMLFVSYRVCILFPAFNRASSSSAVRSMLTTSSACSSTISGIRSLTSMPTTSCTISLSPSIC